MGNNTDATSIFKDEFVSVSVGGENIIWKLILSEESIEIDLTNTVSAVSLPAPEITGAALTFT